MNKYLWALVALLSITIVSGGYLAVNINPSDYYPWPIVVAGVVIGGGVFSFVSLFLFFLSEMYSRHQASNSILFSSMRRGAVAALFALFATALFVVGLAEPFILWGGFLFFVLIEIYYSVFVSK